MRSVRSVVGAAVAVVMALAMPPMGPASADGGHGTPGGPGVGDPVFPNLGNEGYDVRSYHLDLRYDAETRMVDGTVVIDARASKDLSRFNLDSAGLTLHRVDVNGRRAMYVQEGEELVITPRHTLQEDRRFRVRVSYRADPRAIPPPVGGFVATDDGFATAPQPAGAHMIYPCNDHPSDKADYFIKVTAPKGTIGVASGLKVYERKNSNGSTTSAYRTVHPVASEILQVVVGDYTVVDRGRQDGVLLRDVVPSDRVELLEPSLSLTPHHREWAENHFGRFPLEAYGLLPVNTDDPNAFDFTGLETQTLTLYKPKFLERPEKDVGPHMMHEIVHSWFGNYVSPSDWSALWHSEGHATMYALMYRFERGWPDSGGFTNMLDKMKDVYRQGDIYRQQSGPVAKPNADNLWDNQRYTGGVLVLFALQELIGEEKFREIERTILRKYADGIVSTEDFIDTAVSVTGDDSVRPFLEDWLYGTKTPPMPNHPDWTVDPPTTPVAKASLQTDRYGL